MKTLILLIIFLILIFDNPAFAQETLQERYNQVLQRPAYSCHNDICLPIGTVQGDELVDPLTHLPSCIGSGCQKILNPCEGKGFGGTCDEALAENQNNSTQIIQNEEPLNAEMRLMSVAVTNTPVNVGCWATGGQKPYQITMVLPGTLWGSGTRTFYSNFGMVSETFLMPHTGVIFTCDVQDAAGSQTSTFLSIPINDGSSNVVSGQSGTSQPLQNSQGFNYQASPAHEQQSGQSSEQSNNYQDNSQSNNQASEQYSIQQKTIQDDLNKTLEFMGLGLLAIIGLIFMFREMNRRKTTIVEVYRPSFGTGRASFTPDNTTSIRQEGNTIVETRNEIVEWNPVFWQRVKTEFPKDWQRLLEWMAKNADDIALLYSMATDNEKTAREILERARKELKLKIIYCEFCNEVKSSEDELYKHIKRHHGKRNSAIGGE